MPVSIYDVLPAQEDSPPQKTKQKPKGKGVPVASLLAPEQTTPPPAGGASTVSGAIKAVGGAAQKLADDTLKFVLDPKTDPSSIISGTWKALASGGEWMATKAAEGIVGIAKGEKFGKSYNAEAAAGAAKQVQAALSDINSAPADQTEEKVMHFQGLIGEVPHIAGESVFDKTGSALAAAGSETLATLLMLSPEVAGKVLSKVPRAKGTEASKVSGAFDELAAKDPETASGLADHVGQVDPQTAKYMKRRVQKFMDASEKELSIIGRDAAAQSIKELEGNYNEILKTGLDRRSANTIDVPPRAPNNQGIMRREEAASKEFFDKARQEALRKQEMMLTVQTNEKASASIRTAAKEGIEALGAEPVDMSKDPHARAMDRQQVAIARAQREGQTFEHDPEPVPKRAAQVEGEEAKRSKMTESARAAYDRQNKLPSTGETSVQIQTRLDREAELRGTDTKTRDNVPPAKGDPKIVYFNSGVPVTREMVESAFRFTGEIARKIPGVEIAKGKMEKYYNAFIETFNPEAKGAPARTAGAAIAKNFFDQQHLELVTWQKGLRRREYWNKMGPSAGMEFIHGFEKGKKFDNPQWEQSRRAYENWGAEILKQDLKTGFTYDPVDHYMPHLFKDSEGVSRFMQKKYGNKWADPRFIKERGFDLYQEAIDANFTPKYTNPEEIMQARQVASDIAQLRTDLLADLERKGVAVKAPKGSERAPAGFSPNSRRSPTGQRYWVREEIDPLMHNAFDSKSLWQDSGVKGDAFKGFMAAKNAIIPIKLGLSLFHPMHVLHIDASATLGQATRRMVGAPSLASVRDFMLNASTAYLDPLWKNPKIGDPLLKVFQGKRDFSTLSDAQKAAFKDLSEGGLVPTRPKEETSGAIQKFKDAVAKRSATAAWHLPWAALAAVSHPLFSVWIPNLKIASFLKEVKVARELNPLWTDMQRQEAFRQISRKVEARYGEMNYNSMFMNKVYKDIGVATNLSLGWNLGLLDQYVGGSIDLGRAMAERGGLKEKLASGRLDRPVFATYYIASALMIGGVMHYMFTGKQPDKLIDYTHPESGEKDQYGKPVRLNTMFYTREFEGLYKHMEQEGAMPGLEDFVKNKGSGMIEMARTGLSGVDSLGNDIWNENDPAYLKVERGLLNAYGALEPISVEAIKKSTSADQVKSTALSVLGFTPAGKYISETETEGKIADRYNRYVRPKEKPFKAVEMAKDMKELREMFLKDDPKYDEKLDKVAAAYDLTGKDIAKIQKLFNSPKEAEFDPSVWMFSHLPWEVQKPLLDKMTEEERELYLSHVSKSKKQKYARETEE